MERHSLRCHLLACAIAEREGWKVDEEVLLLAAILHDIGIYPSVTSGGVYTREGADLAAAIAGRHGWEEERVRRCAEAVDRHHDLRDQLSRGPEVEALRRADAMELTAGLRSFGFPRARFRGLRRDIPPSGIYREIARLTLVALVQRPLTLPRIFLR